MPEQDQIVLETVVFIDKSRNFTNNFGLHFSIILLHLDHNTIIFEQHLEGHEGGIQSGSHKWKELGYGKQMGSDLAEIYTTCFSHYLYIFLSFLFIITMLFLVLWLLSWSRGTNLVWDFAF